ncbi:hypothetical protein PsorP6_001201 [Peronosclerospora sorghi]|uniref:Uncharacterized protein n=1 Tax=Peronosclerospora sorghi TaxID=230839 RepID=A0ACC0WWM7_9STRA|nr:hypothetical protein PsorP6_001201 [Peronosclerospora sorghi]
MSSEAFHQIVNAIQDHPVFQNSSRNPQASVVLQLACTLDRLGHSGNGVSITRTLLLWGIGYGTVVTFTERCLAAISETLNYHVRWPDSNERKRMSNVMASKGFPELRIQINHPEKYSKRCMDWIEIDEWDLERDHQSQGMRDIALSGDGQLMRERVEATCLAINRAPGGFLYDH